MPKVQYIRTAILALPVTALVVMVLAALLSLRFDFALAAGWYAITSYMVYRALGDWE